MMLYVGIVGGEDRTGVNVKLYIPLAPGYLINAFVIRLFASWE